MLSRIQYVQWMVGIYAAILLIPLLSVHSKETTDTPTSNSNSNSNSNKPPHCKNDAKVLTPHYLFRTKIEDYTNSTETFYDIVRKGKKTFVNKHEKTYERKDLYSKCNFTPLQQRGPVPIVYICAGRSGSSNTWMTLSNLAGGEPNEALETFGSNPNDVNDFLDYLESEEKGSWWVEEHLCEITKHNCNSAIAGFQWKPYGDSMTSPAGRGALKKIASFSMDGNNNSGEKIRVLYMTRNPIDVIMSGLKHKKSGISAHCDADDVKCMKKHENNLLLMPTHKLLETLKEAEEHVSLVENTLTEMGIHYYRTTYEKLYSSNDANEWMNIFAFFGRGPTHGLTLDDVEKAFPYAKTSKRSREEVLENYDELKDLLDGTEYEHYLDE
jgi:hypothetical protein